MFPASNGMKIKRGDTILVIAGKDRGKTGKVIAVDKKQNLLKVSGLNVSKRHRRPQGAKVAGGITEIVMPLPAGKVMFMCSHCNKPVRLGQKITSAGNKERICKICKSTV